MTPRTLRHGLQRATWIVLAIVLVAFDLVATGWFGANERLVAMCRNVVFPGLGFIETNVWLTILFAVVAGAAVIAWLRWGADWLAALVWAVAVVVAFEIVPTAHAHGPAHPAGATPVARASHEFAAVLVVVAMLGRARLFLAGLPGVRRSSARHSNAPTDRTTALLAAGPVERCRAVAIAELARNMGCSALDPATATAAVEAPDVRRRAARVGAVARWRIAGDPLRRDHAHVRSALVLCERATPEQERALRVDARSSPYGVPASEPTWVRLLDGTLAALALDDLGEPAVATRWRGVLVDDLRLRHGRRSGAIHTPTSLRLATAQAWEHAGATALLRWRGWIEGDADWTALRQRSLGAAARGARRPDDARLVAAARIWARLVGDLPATRILERPSRSTDAIAASLDDVLATINVPPGVGDDDALASESRRDGLG